MDNSLTPEQYQEMCSKLIQTVAAHLRVYWDIDRGFLNTDFNSIRAVYFNTYEWYFLKDIERDLNETKTNVFRIYMNRDNVSILDYAHQCFREYLEQTFGAKYLGREFEGSEDDQMVVYTIEFTHEQYNALSRLDKSEITLIIGDARQRFEKYSAEIMNSLKFEIKA